MPHGAPESYNDIDLQPDKLGRDFGIALGTALRPTIFDRNGATLNPTEFTQSIYKSSRPWTED
jgi:hypothetical protein